MRRAHCGLCGAVQHDHLFEKDGYQVVRCLSCGLVQVDLEVVGTQIEELYNEAYFTDEVFHDYLGEREARIEGGAADARALAKVVPGGKLLDVGCAAGFFLHAASRHYDVTGVELSPFAAEYARRELGLRVLTGTAANAGLEGERFDVITLWNTIEHMTDPVASLQAIARLAEPNALLAISTGDVSGPLARRNLRAWNLMSPPYHLFFFSPRTIDLLLARTGFRLRRIVYDGVVAEHGPLATPRAQQLASLLGLGNVMTVYASRSDAGAPSRSRRLVARYRPLRWALQARPSRASRA